MPVSQQYANSQGPTDIRGEGEAGDSIMPRAQAYQQANGTTLAQDAGGRGSNNIAVECPHCHRDFDSEKNLSVRNTSYAPEHTL